MEELIPRGTEFTDIDNITELNPNTELDKFLQEEEQQEEKEKEEEKEIERTPKNFEGHPCEFCDFFAKTPGGMNLHLINRHPVEAKAMKKAKGKKGKRGRPKEEATLTNDKGEKKIFSSRSVPFPADTLALMQMLINSGVAPDIKTLVQQSIYEKAYKSGIQNGVGKMNNDSNTNPNKVMEKMMDAQMSKRIMDMMGGNQPNGKSSGNFDMKEIVDLMKQQYTLKMLSKGLGEGEGGSMFSGMPKEMAMQMQMQMFQNMTGGNKPDPQIAILQQQIQQMALQNQQLVQQMKDEQFKTVIENLSKQQSDKKDGFQDYLAVTEKIRTGSDERIRALEQEIKKREIDNLRLEQVTFQEKMNDIIQGMTQQQLGGFSEKFRHRFEERLLDKLDMDNLMNEKKEGGWDKVIKTVGAVAENLAPVLQPMIEAKSQQWSQPKPPSPSVSQEDLMKMELERMKHEQHQHAETKEGPPPGFIPPIDMQQQHEHIMPNQPPQGPPQGMPTPIGDIPYPNEQDFYSDKEEMDSYKM